jgi:hypothetical protein
MYIIILSLESSVYQIVMPEMSLNRQGICCIRLSTQDVTYHQRCFRRTVVNVFPIEYHNILVKIITWPAKLGRLTGDGIQIPEGMKLANTKFNLENLKGRELGTHRHVDGRILLK